MSEEIKICRDCKHRFKIWRSGEDLCKRNTSVKVDPVTGRGKVEGLIECWVERADHEGWNSCGVSGKYFEPKR
jgi:hypothetical protein